MGPEKQVYNSLKRSFYPVIGLWFCVFVQFSCSTGTAKSDEKQIIDTVKKPENKIKATNNNVIKKRIFAYTDSVEIYKNHFDTSNVIGYLNFLDTYERLNEYDKGFARWYLIYPEWMGIFYKGDTCWVKRSDRISSKLDIDTIGDLVLLNRYGHCEFGGTFDCYVNTKVFKINPYFKKTNFIIEKSLELESCRQLNDSLYLLTNNYNWIRIYNSKTEDFIYQNHGGSLVIREYDSKIFFLKFDKDTVDRFKYTLRKEIPCELIMFDFLSKREIKIFKEKDIAKKPYSCGPDLCHLSALTLKDTIDNLLASFSLNKMKPKPVHESDAYFYNYTIDTFGNVVSLELYDTDSNGRLKKIGNDSIRNLILKY